MLMISINRLLNPIRESTYFIMPRRGVDKITIHTFIMLWQNSFHFLVLIYIIQTEQNNVNEQNLIVYIATMYFAYWRHYRMGEQGAPHGIHKRRCSNYGCQKCMQIKAPICFNFLNFHPTFWQVNYVTNLHGTKK